MKPRLRLLAAALAGAALIAGSVRAADLSASLTKGTPDLKSVSVLAFGPEGILFVGDPQGAAIFAIGTGDTQRKAGNGALKVEGIDSKIGSLLGTDAKGLRVNDLAVNPASGNAYLAVTRGQGPDAAPVLLKVQAGGKIDEVALKDVPFAKAVLPNAPGDARSRPMAITKIAFVKDRVFVAGLSNEQWASTLRAIPFPFKDVDKGTGIQIYHGAHGKLETQAPIRTFVPYEINGQAHLLAAYQCTPLVKLSVDQLKPGEKVQGTTVAELGNRNMPLDMIVYEKNGKDFILIANNARGVMKVTTENIGDIKGISDPVRGGGTAGLKYESITDLKGVVQLDRLDKNHALVLLETPSGMNLETIDLP
jgi:hypothetical protein